MITCRGLGKVYLSGDVKTEALKKINFSVGDGEFIAIMGTSGSGKSTLLNILGCMDAATSGEYWFRDVFVNDLKGEKLHHFRKEHISFIFQNFALLPQYTVYENVEIPLLARNMKRSERKKRIMEQLDLMGIGELADKLPAHISGGQQQRCAIARALVTGNELILADEPTGALDQKTGKDIMQVLLRLREEGKTLLLVTHDPMVAEFADRVIFIEDGKILEK